MAAGEDSRWRGWVGPAVGTELGSFLDFLYARAVGASVASEEQGLRRSWRGERRTRSIGGSSLRVAAATGTRLGSFLDFLCVRATGLPFAAGRAGWVVRWQARAGCGRQASGSSSGPGVWHEPATETVG